MSGRFALTIAVLAVLAAPAAAAETAREILERQRGLADGARRWSDRQQTLSMQVVDPSRAPRTLVLDLFDQHGPAGVQRTMLYLSAPRAVQGTALLAVAHPGRAADQWLYLPEQRRARRIAGAARTQPFLGTDFTYHDLDLLAEMPSWREADADAVLRGEAVVDGTPCHVIDLTPRREDIGYARIGLWLGKEDLVARRVELFAAAPTSGWFGAADEGHVPTRRITQSDVRTVGAIPVPHRAEVETPAAGTKTMVTFAKVTFDQQLPDDLFTQAALEWGSYQPRR